MVYSNRQQLTQAETQNKAWVEGSSTITLFTYYQLKSISFKTRFGNHQKWKISDQMSLSAHLPTTAASLCVLGAACAVSSAETP